MSAVLNHAIKRFVQTSAQRAAVQGPSAQSGLHAGAYKTWKNVSIFAAGPAIILCAINCVLTHLDHQKHPHERHFTKYEYLTVRTKKFPWGDGNHSVFHNPQVNALPDGFEE